jgi:hypothetical protein
MATNVEKSPVSREVHGRKSGDYIASMQSDGLYIREKGKRTLYGPLSWDFLSQKGGELAAFELIHIRQAGKRKVSRGLLATQAGK